MRYKPQGHLSEIRRVDPRKLVDAGDSGLIRQNGDHVDLHALLTENSVSVRLVRVCTNSMRPSGLHQGGIAIVDRGKPTKDGQIVHVRYNGDEIIRRLRKRAGQWFLVADDPRIDDLFISDEDFVEKLGVVTAGIIFTTS
ncbi:S24 family peptidase [Flavihumibacter sp. RY-1]|uniref:S24 family peptidase n=1 Tax=Flavihumibacter fluminis TaxID=2909236 RepID=A0ABS9BL63_9BACT|nr:S24 family peptidase [Flavihumibacter fluminis]MCF1715376.1 S24 family peptidase [Flavihumibacter fluminis]